MTQSGHYQLSNPQHNLLAAQVAHFYAVVDTEGEFWMKMDTNVGNLTFNVCELVYD